MKSKILRWVIASAALTTPLHAEYRSWTSMEGSKIDAELVSNDSTNVTLRLRGGKLSTFPQTKLSLADRDFLKENKTVAAAEPAAQAKTSVPADRKAKWLNKMDKAQEQSKETGLPILVLFTGTSWCPYCIKLEKAVFSEKDFKSYADQNLVLLMLDFGPGGSPKNRKDEKLKESFGVTGFPTYFLTDSEGRQLSKGGYHDGINPSEFANWVKASAPKS